MNAISSGPASVRSSLQRGVIAFERRIYCTYSAINHGVQKACPVAMLHFDPRFRQMRVFGLRLDQSCHFPAVQNHHTYSRIPILSYSLRPSRTVAGICQIGLMFIHTRRLFNPVSHPPAGRNTLLVPSSIDNRGLPICSDLFYAFSFSRCQPGLSPKPRFPRSTASAPITP